MWSFYSIVQGKLIPIYDWIRINAIDTYKSHIGFIYHHLGVGISFLLSVGTIILKNQLHVEIRRKSFNVKKIKLKNLRLFPIYIVQLEVAFTKKIG